MKFEKVFFFEGILSLFSGLSILFFAEDILISQGFESNPLAVYNFMQFGSLVFLLGWMGVFSPVLPSTIIALLIGDIIWCYVFYLQVQLLGSSWTISALFSFFITAFLALLRCIYLFMYLFSSSSSSSRKQSSKKMN